MPSAIRIAEAVVDELLKQARADSGRECCGLLGGTEGLISRAYPAANASPNPATSYEIAPTDLFRLMREIRVAGLSLLGIYHSHPNGMNEPSRNDLQRATYPDAAYFIISPSDTAPRPVRAFSIHDGIATEVEILRW